MNKASQKEFKSLTKAIKASVKRNCPSQFQLFAQIEQFFSNQNDFFRFKHQIKASV